MSMAGSTEAAPGPGTAEQLEAYAGFWQQLGPETLDRIPEWFTEDARFCDPFNDVTGHRRIRAVFAHSYELVTDVAIDLGDRAVGQQAGYLRWTYRYRTRKGGRPWRIEGMSEIRFAADGRVAEHVDHWDAAGQVYEKLPVLGGVLGMIKRKLQP